MRKIVINGDYLAFETFAGVSRYATEILTEFDLLVEGLDIEILTPEYTTERVDFKNIKLVKKGNESLLKWKNTSLPKYIKKNNAILIDLTQAFPVGIRGITCVHDCIPELIPTAYSGFGGKFIKKPLKKLQRRIAIKNSLALITVSDFSKKDIAKLYGVSESKITVIGNAWQHIKRTDYDESIITKYNLNNVEFFFTLGSRVEHKNLKWIVSAANQNKDKLFVVSGENKYKKDFNEKNFPENIVFTGYVTDGEIRSLMSKCKAFILPSIYEGFGIPPMEALAEGAEIIVSNRSCLPGIYEDSAHYIDPLQYNNIDLEKILATSVGNPLNVLDKYSWKKSAEKLYQLVVNYK